MVKRAFSKEPLASTNCILKVIYLNTVIKAGGLLASSGFTVWTSSRPDLDNDGQSPRQQVISDDGVKADVICLAADTP